MLNGDIMVNAITGSTGAGVKPGATGNHFWRNNNMSVYKAFEHQHVPEIKQSLKQLQNSFDSDIDFIPYRGDFPRGIFTTIVIKTKVALEEIVAIVRRILCQRLLYAYRRQEHRFEASCQHQQVPYPSGKAWRQTSCHLLHRQLAERSQRTSGT